MKYSDLPSVQDISAGARLNSAVCAVFHELDMAPAKNSNGDPMEHPACAQLMEFFLFLADEVNERRTAENKVDIDVNPVE